MIFFATLLVLALPSTYLAFYRYEIHVELPLLVGLASWSLMIPAAGNLTIYSGGETFVTTSRSMQAVCMFMALICAFALVGAVFDEFPTEKMEDAKEYKN